MSLLVSDRDRADTAVFTHHRLLGARIHLQAQVPTVHQDAVAVSVEVQLDGGSWLEAELSAPLSDDAWVQWKVDLDLSEGDHELAVRATDGTGFTQSPIPVPPAPDGAEGWHTIRFSASAS